jgi:Icc-related predicted phosphoesterase
LIHIISDIHGAVAALRALVKSDPGTLLILGDLINFIDYRDHTGIVSEVAGGEFVADVVRLRTAGDFTGAGELWRNYSRGHEEEYRHRYATAIAAAYDEICEPLDGASGYVTYGNVDNPDVMKRYLPSSMRFVEAERIEIEGEVFGIVGGGVPTINSPGEIDDRLMSERLASIGHVDVLCTHVAPAVRPLAADVVGGRAKGSVPVREYLERHQPRVHYFGDIHQPQAVSWTIGTTTCVNVGYFRATGRAIAHYAG